MDDEKLQWIVELVDKISGPAGKAARETAKLEAKLKEIAKSQADYKMKQIADSTKETNGALRSLTGTAVALGAALIAAGIAGVTMLAKKGAEMALDAMIFKDNAIEALKAFVGSDEAAGKAFKSILDMAKFFHQAPEAMSDGINKLLAAGLKMDEAMSLMQTALDVHALVPGSQVDDVVGSFIEIQHAAEISMKQIKKLGGGSELGAKRIIEVLGSLHGIDTSTAEGVKHVEALLKSGKIGSDELMASVQQGIMKITGSTKAGEFAAKHANTTFEGLIDGIKNAPKQFFMRMNVQDGPLRAFLKQMNDALDPESPTGRRIIKFLEDISSKLVGFLSGVDPLKFVEGMIDFAAATVKVVTALGGLKKGFMDAIGPSVYLLQQFGIAKDKGDALAKVIYILAYATGALTAILIIGFAVVLAGIAITVAGLILLIGGFVAIMALAAIALASPFIIAGLIIYGIYKGVVAIMDGAKAWGTAIVDGLWNGIKAAWRGMIEGIKGLVELLPSAVKKVLGISSPSKVMMELGMYTMLGFEKGINDNADGASNALVGAVSTTSTLASLTSGGGASTRGSVSIGDIHIHMSGAGVDSPQQTASAIAVAVRREIEAYVEGSAMAVGEAAA